MFGLIDQQQHGYRDGHQLLSTTVKLSREDQDIIDRLSDISGPIRPGETFEPYLTAYPLPSESHYVLAKTWQDHGVPRAGCVLTRSLLIPMALWINMESLSEFLPLLRPVRRDDQLKKVEPETLSLLPLVDDARSVEIVEAIFLERRKPIVVFEASGSDAIAARILTALWPALRRSFSVCTYALAPRRLSKQSFDLLFSPASARSRFSDWQGRRIEKVPQHEPRHRWSLTVADRIFRSDRPDLMGADPLGILHDGANADESSLRLSLLWEELRAKADANPAAVLGLLDILNSQRSKAWPQTSAEQLFPLMKNSVSIAAKSLNANEQWLFLNALAGKFSERGMPFALEELLRTAARDLSKSAPKSALQFVQGEIGEGRVSCIPLWAGVGDGLSEHMRKIGSLLLNLRNAALFELMKASRPFASGAVALAKAFPDEWTHRITSALRTGPKHEQNKVREELATLIADEASAPLFDALLSDAEGDEFRKIASIVLYNTEAKCSSFDYPLINAARAREEIDYLRNFLSNSTGLATSDVDRILCKTLSLATHDLDWVRTHFEPRRAFALVRPLIDQVSGDQLRQILFSGPLTNSLVSLIVQSLPESASAVVQVLCTGRVPIKDALELAKKATTALSREQSYALSRVLLEQVFSEGDCGGNGYVGNLLENVVAGFGPRTIFDSAIVHQSQPERVGDNLGVIASGPEVLRTWLSDHIKEVCERLVGRGPLNLGESGFAAWAGLLSGSANSDSQLSAASISLAHSLRLRRFPASPVIVAAFPTVYRELLNSKEGDEVNIPAFLFLPMSFFVDWDRARSARKELVDAFVSSVWPPVDLLVVAMDTNIEGFLFEYLGRTSDGRNYLRSILRSAESLVGAKRGRAKELFDAFGARHWKY